MQPKQRNPDERRRTIEAVFGEILRIPEVTADERRYLEWLRRDLLAVGDERAA